MLGNLFMSEKSKKAHGKNCMSLSTPSWPVSSSMYVFMYVCMYVCMCACYDTSITMYVRTHVCMYVMTLV